MKANKIIELAEKIHNSAVSTVYELTVLAAIAGKEGGTITDLLGATSAASDAQRKQHQRFNRVTKRLTRTTQKATGKTYPSMVKYGKTVSADTSGPSSRTLYLTARGKKELAAFNIPKNPKDVKALSDLLDASCINTLTELSALIQFAKNDGQTIRSMVGEGGVDVERRYQRFKNTSIRLSGVAHKTPELNLPKLVKIKSSGVGGRAGNKVAVTARGRKELSKFGL